MRRKRHWTPEQKERQAEMMRDRAPWLKLSKTKTPWGLICSNLNWCYSIQKANDMPEAETAIQVAEALLKSVQLRLKLGLSQQEEILTDLRLATKLLCKFSNQPTKEILARLSTLYRDIILPQRQTQPASMSEKEQTDLLATTEGLRSLGSKAVASEDSPSLPPTLDAAINQQTFAEDEMSVQT